MGRKKRARSIAVVIATALTIVVAACNQQRPENERDAPHKGQPNSGALLSDRDIDGASPRYDEQNHSIHLPAPTVRGFTAITSSPTGTLRVQGAMGSAFGRMALIHHTPTNPQPWELHLFDDIEGVPVQVYTGNREIQSVAVSLDGDSLVFSMREVAGSGDFEVYRFTVSTATLEQLTSNSTADLDVSISADGATIAWEGASPANKRALIVREYSGGSYSQLMVSSSSDLAQPSLSSNGAFVALLYTFAANDLAAALYDRNTSSLVLVDDGTPRVRAHPSPSSNGEKVAWLEPGVSQHTVQLATPDTMTVTTAFASSSAIDHPHLTADGTSLVYGEATSGRIELFIRALADGTPQQVTTTTTASDNLGAFWQKGSTTSQVCDALAGAPTAPVTSAIPDCTFEARAEDYAFGHPDMGNVPISFNTLMLAFTLSTTVQEANALLSSIEAEIVGGVPGSDGDVEGVLFLRVPLANHTDMANLIGDLNDDPKVLVAVQDALLGTTAVPQKHENPPNSADYPNAWTWESITPNADDGNHGLKLVRVPQMWHFNAALAKQAPAPVQVGVLEHGFGFNHPDLDLGTPAPGPQSDPEHGTHVAGIIAAKFNNSNVFGGIGIDGISPYASVVPTTIREFQMCAPASQTANSDVYIDWLRISAGQVLSSGLSELLRNTTGVRVVNLSLGYNWSRPFSATCDGIPVYYPATNQDDNSAAQEIVTAQAKLLKLVLSALSRSSTLPLIVSAAGNDSDDGSGQNPFGAQQARWSSPVNYAGLVLDESSILVVEAVDHADTRAFFSNAGGNISAPGVCIMSTTPSTVAGSNGDCYTESYEVKDTERYSALTGTSFAAPHVTGVASYLLALDPTLTTTDLRTLLLNTSVPALPHPNVNAPISNRVDAYAAALAIDQLKSNKRILGMLLDIDDGTPDGNQRVLITAEGLSGTTDSDENGVVDGAPTSNTPLTHSPTDFGSISATEVIGEDADQDGGAGNGTIDMADFRRWRDWYLQTNQLGDHLNGSASHYKKDVNSHPKAGINPTIDNHENVFPRGDFNGDGTIHLTATASIPGFTNPVTDLEVMQLSGLWTDFFYEAQDLPNLIESGDLEIWVRDLYELPGAALVISRVLDEPSPYWRVHTPMLQRQIYTLPAGTHTAAILVLDAQDTIILELWKEFTTVIGGDAIWGPLASLSADVVDSYDGPAEDCPRLEGEFTASIKGLYPGTMPNIPVIPGATAAMSIEGAGAWLMEHDKLSNDPLIVTAKTVRSCNLYEGPNQTLGFLLQHQNAGATAGFFFHIWGEFSNLDNRWPMYTWNRTDLSTDVDLCPVVPLDITTTHVSGRPAAPQTAAGVQAGQYYGLLARFETTYEQSFVNYAVEPPFEIRRAQFRPEFLDAKYIYNGVAQWIHSIGFWSRPACLSQPLSGADLSWRQSKSEIELTMLYEQVDLPQPEIEPRKGNVKIR